MSVELKAHLQFEKNVEKSKFEYGYLYEYPVLGSGSPAIVTFPAYPALMVEYTFGRIFCYRLLDNDIEIFVCDKLRDISRYINEKSCQEK